MVEIDSSIADHDCPVTGGLGGVGSEIVTAILESGGDVICFDLPREVNVGELPLQPDISPTTKSLDVEKFHDTAKVNETRYIYCPVNVTDGDEISKSLEAVISLTRFPLRGVVTCAGISGEVDAADYPPEAFRKLLDINIMGTFLPVQAAGRVMQKQKSSGSVILVASISGHVSNKAFPYSLPQFNVSDVK